MLLTRIRLACFFHHGPPSSELRFFPAACAERCPEHVDPKKLRPGLEGLTPTCYVGGCVDSGVKNSSNGTDSKWTASVLFLLAFKTNRFFPRGAFFGRLLLGDGPLEVNLSLVLVT